MHIIQAPLTGRDVSAASGSFLETRRTRPGHKHQMLCSADVSSSSPMRDVTISAATLGGLSVLNSRLSRPDPGCAAIQELIPADGRCRLERQCSIVHEERQGFPSLGRSVSTEPGTRERQCRLFARERIDSRRGYWIPTATSSQDRRVTDGSLVPYLKPPAEGRTPRLHHRRWPSPQ